eukprot:Pgem_evm2s15058
MPGQGADEVIYYRGRTVEKQSRPEAILFKNARIFDGVSDKLAEPQDVLVVGKLIKEIGKDLKYPAEVVEVLILLFSTSSTICDTSISTSSLTLSRILFI